MAAEYGFVYVLRNECMPGIYKIGMTSRAPSQRCDELSAATSAPVPFEIVCFGRVKGARGVERWFHRHLGGFRVTAGREFFRLSSECVGGLIACIKGMSHTHGLEFFESEVFAWDCRIEERDAMRHQQVRHFVEQHHDLNIQWELPAGFSGFGDARRSFGGARP